MIIAGMPSTLRSRRHARATAILERGLGPPPPAAATEVSWDSKTGGGSITAAAQIVSGRRIQRDSNPRKWSTERQDEAYGFYDDTEVIGFSMKWQSNAVSRLRLYPAFGVDGRADEGTPQYDLLDEFAGGRGGQAQLLKRAAEQLVLGGESWIVAHTSDRWQACSHREIQFGGPRNWAVDDGTTDRPVTLPPDTLVIRAWQAHPLKFAQPDSAFMRMLPVLRELRGMTQYVGAQIDSTLAGNGILFLPQSISIAGQKDGTSIAEVLTEVAATAIENRSDASSLVPIIAQVPDDVMQWIGQDKWVTFRSPLDQQAKELRDESIRRIALGADVPPEIILGLAGASHWGSWRISDDATQIAVVPVGEVIAHALTTGWYRYALQQIGVPDWWKWRIGVDAHELELRPDRSAAAVSLYDRGELTGKSLRRENGFTEDDKPTDEERQQVLLRQVLKDSNVTDPSALAGLPEQLTRAQEETKRGTPVAPGRDLSPVTNTRPGTDAGTGAVLR